MWLQKKWKESLFKALAAPLSIAFLMSCSGSQKTTAGDTPKILNSSQQTQLTNDQQDQNADFTATDELSSHDDIEIVIYYAVTPNPPPAPKTNTLIAAMAGRQAYETWRAYKLSDLSTPITGTSVPNNPLATSFSFKAETGLDNPENLIYFERVLYNETKPKPCKVENTNWLMYNTPHGYVPVINLAALQNIGATLVDLPTGLQMDDETPGLVIPPSMEISDAYATIPSNLVQAPPTQIINFFQSSCVSVADDAFLPMSSFVLNGVGLIPQSNYLNQPFYASMPDPNMFDHLDTMATKAWYFNNVFWFDHSYIRQVMEEAAISVLSTEIYLDYPTITESLIQSFIPVDFVEASLEE